MAEKVWLGGIYLKDEGGYEIILKSLNHYKNRLKTLSQSPEVKDAGGTFGSILNQQARKTVPKINEVIEKIQTGLQDVQVLKKIEQLILDNKNINKQLKQLKMNPLNIDNNSSNKEKINDVIFEYNIFNEMMIRDLKPTAENILKNSESKIVCLISKIDNKASIVIAVNKDYTEKYSAVEMVKHVSETLGGKGGGGRPDMAQSGGSSPEKSDKAIEMLKEYIRK
jgi:alanyl-tRNA synthetase